MTRSENSVEKDAGVLALVLFQNVSLHGAAHIGQYESAYVGRLFGAGRPAVFNARNARASGRWRCSGTWPGSSVRAR